MPELPEVETIKRGLESEIISKTIVDIDVIHAKTVLADFDILQSYGVGASVDNLWRRGKVLGIDLNTGYSFLIHLKMTGQLIYSYDDKAVDDYGQKYNKDSRISGGHPSKSMIGSLPDSSTRVVVYFSDDSQLYFNDQRKFGWIKMTPKSQIDSDPLLKSMGTEPLSVDFTFEEFRSKIGHRRSPVKAALLDQHNMAGIGNIYADESLHLAKIHPLTKPLDLSEAELIRLHQAIIKILSSGIEHGGTTLRDYINHEGESGDYLVVARVFDRQGENCPVCISKIEKIKVAGRGTHYCPSCQIPKS